jgi:hypothetical protein
MAILIRCACGKQLQVKDELAGRRAKCPQCGDIFTVPDNSQSAPPSQAVSKDKPPALPQPRDKVEDERDRDEDLDERPRRGRRRDEDDYADEEDDDRLRRRRRREDDSDDDDDDRGPRRGSRARRGRHGSESGRLSRRDLHSVAVYQKVLLLCILSYIILMILAGVIAPPAMKLIFLLIAMLASIVAVVFVFMLSLKVYSVGTGVVLAILTLLPLIGLIMLLIINAKATNVLKSRGYSVGFLGASLSQFR